jgi:hypothetical protein
VNTTEPEELDDGELVTRSSAGDVEAFREIVARYYLLISTLAYHATGSLSQSDNLARDTFVAAWTQLADLREPVRLRSWLCGIARNLIDDFLCHRDTRGCGDFTPSGTGFACLSKVRKSAVQYTNRFVQSIVRRRREPQP